MNCFVRSFVLFSLPNNLICVDKVPGSVHPEKYDRGSESLRISFLEAVYGFRVLFLSLYIF